MWNIMKAQNYQIRRDNLCIYALLAGLLLSLFAVLTEGDISSIGDWTGSEYLAMAGGNFFIIFLVISLIFVPRICGWDSVDKTMNYEVLSGHYRREVYFGRIFISLLWVMISGMILTILPVGLFSALQDWGCSMNLREVALRYVLALFPLFRLICEFALLTFLIRNCYAAMVIGFVLCDGAIIIDIVVIEELMNKTLVAPFAITNLIYLFDFSNYSIEYINGADVAVYTTALSSSAIVSTIAVSLAVGIACLGLGYAVFRRRDMA